MNNEDKRFKQINRIAKPIQVNNTDNQNGEVNNIPPKQPPKKPEKKRIGKEAIFIFIIILLVILCLGAFIFVLVILNPNPKTSSLKYNDKTTTTTSVDDVYFIDYITLAGENKIYLEGTYNVNNINLTLNSNGSYLNIYVNGKLITTANYLVSKVGFVDDLIMFTTQNTDNRTTNFYIVDATGEIISNIYNYDSIDGMVLTDNNAVNYNPNSIVISMSRVNNNLIYNSNKMGNNTSANICDEDSLFQNSIETKNPVKINYSLEYLGNHTFSKYTVIYEESIDEYKANNNLCN